MESLKYLKNVFKVSIVILLLLLCLGSIYAAEDSHDNFNVVSEYDSDDDGLDEDLDDDSDDDGLDEDLDEDLDDNFNDSDVDYSDYDYLKFKILLYLEKYGNVTDENWTDSEKFLNDYQIYLLNSSNYVLNESAEGYETYLKIYDSITSTFGDYNLTENETEYLKFLIIFYLNNYGNVSANYTWNESDDFSKFYPEVWYTLSGMVLGSASDIDVPSYKSSYLNSNLNSMFNLILNNSTGNSTSNNNVTTLDVPQNEDSWWSDVLMLVLILVLVVLVVI